MKESSVKKQWRKLDEALSEEIKRCEGLIQKYADVGAGHTAAFADIKSGVARAEEALKEKDLPKMIRSYMELQNLS